MFIVKLMLYVNYVNCKCVNCKCVNCIRDDFIKIDDK